MERVRAAAATEPGRLRIVGAGLVVLILAFGAVTSWQSKERADAARQVLHHSQQLSADAADIYRSLADANTAESSAFLSGGAEPAGIRDRYKKDIERAANKLTTAAASTDLHSDSADAITDLNRLLPVYTGYIERARAGNRGGIPLGAAYLRRANSLMQDEMLVAAERLYKNENAQLRADYDDATPYPWAAMATGAVALGALVWAQRRTYRRTNRVLNRGLLAATAATAVALLWLSVGHTVARLDLDDSNDHGVRSLLVLDNARIAALKARGNENLTLVSRGAETTDDNKDTYDVAFDEQMARLGGRNGSGGYLGQALALADDTQGRKPVEEAIAQVKTWQKRHAEARASDDAGSYADALNKIIGPPGKPSPGTTTGASFDKADAALSRAIRQEEIEFRRSAEDGNTALNGLPEGAAVLAVLAAAGALTGVGRRLADYR